MGFFNPTVDIVWSLSDLWLQNTARVVGKQKGLVVTVRDVLGRGVRDVVCCEVPSDRRLAGQGALCTDLVCEILTTNHSRVQLTTAAKAVRAATDGVGVALEEAGTLSGLLEMLFASGAWVSEDTIEGEGTKCQK